MKKVLFILAILTLNKANGFSRLDTLANWQIYYGDKLITAGHEPNARTPYIGTIIIKGQNQKLKVLYSYDAAKPEWRDNSNKNRDGNFV